MTEASNRDAVARELAELGEEPLSPEELALLAAGEDDNADIDTVARLHELAEPFAFDDLSELERAQSWKGVESRLPAIASATGTETGTETGTGTGTSGGAGGAGGRVRWLFPSVTLAAAAAAVLVLILRPPSDQGPSPEEIAEIGQQARTMLAALDDGRSDSERADEVAGHGAGVRQVLVHHVVVEALAQQPAADLRILGLGQALDGVDPPPAPDAARQLPQGPIGIVDGPRQGHRREQGELLMAADG
ncbi:MAG: hypothetical protein KC457_22070, partial [Myxococcales bacterium]|nr:hypothetical protein [Myxococcales bacterium]